MDIYIYIHHGIIHHQRVLSLLIGWTENLKHTMHEISKSILQNVCQLISHSPTIRCFQRQSLLADLYLIYIILQKEKEKRILEMDGMHVLKDKFYFFRWSDQTFTFSFFFFFFFDIFWLFPHLLFLFLFFFSLNLVFQMWKLTDSNPLVHYFSPSLSDSTLLSLYIMFVVGCARAKVLYLISVSKL